MARTHATLEWKKPVLRCGGNASCDTKTDKPMVRMRPSRLSR